MPDSPRPPLACPKCGATMNCHAEKPREPRTPDEVRLADATFFGVNEGRYGCPHCGASESRLLPFPL